MACARQHACQATHPSHPSHILAPIQHLATSPLLPASTMAARRDGDNVYAVNSLAFHPQFGTFVTAGSDGAYNFWDKDSKQRLKAMAKCSLPIPCGDFNRQAAAAGGAGWLAG